jgi:hypothetical protein
MKISKDIDALQMFPLPFQISKNIFFRFLGIISKDKIERTLSFRVQSGKITVCDENSCFAIYKK